MVIGTARHHVIAALNEHMGHRPSVINHLLLIAHKRLVHGLLKRHRLGGDHMHQRPALLTWEHGPIKLFIERFVAMGREYQTTPRATQRFVGRRGHHMRKWERAWVEASGNQARNMRHIDHQPSAHFIGDSAKTPPVHYA